MPRLPFFPHTKPWLARTLVGATLAGVLLGALGNAGQREFTDEERGHWAFRPVVRPEPPPVTPADRVDNPIDAFVLKRLQAAGLDLSAEADRRTLIRRVTFDVLGLPPAPGEIESFLADTAPRAYERLVDRLLANPHYGEHWGRLWLDVVRYAETAGYNADPLRPEAWRYRDYCIAAFNSDRPFDRFIQEQIAGDEMFPDDRQALLGSGYVLMWPDESNASNILLARQDFLNDLTANVGSAFLGLSIGCAQCHDHKFDPIGQRDFYRLQAFFSGLIRRDKAAVGPSEEIARWHAAEHRWLAETATVREALRRLEFEARVKAAGDRRMKFPRIVLDALDTLPEDRTTLQRQIAFWSERQIEIKDSEIASHLTPEQKEQRQALSAQLAELHKQRPRPTEELPGMIAGEIEAQPPPTFLLAGGSYDKPLDEVTPGFLTVLASAGPLDAAVAAPHPYTSGRRTALARWLSDPSNPLVPRVIVNRLWQGHFGVGLIENGNDFGTQTPPPSHPELLDWLAAELVAPREFAVEEQKEKVRSWSLKHIHRLIVTSSVYRQAGLRANDGARLEASAAADPGNRLYGHFPRRRLNAEALRDALLAVSGRLNPALFGPSVLPALPADFSRREAWKVSTSRDERDRRSIYIHAKRNLPYPLLEAFDLPDMHESCARRAQTTVAPQALMLLNSDVVLDYARSFAGRILRDNPHGDVAQAIHDAYCLAWGRDAEPGEVASALEFVERQQELAAQARAAGAPLLLPAGMPKFLDPSRASALVDLCHALVNASEFLYVD